MQQTKGRDRHGFSLAPNSHETPEQVRLYTRMPVYCLLGFLPVRFVDELPAGVLPLLVDGRDVLPLAEVRRAHGPLAELVDRHEHRRADEPGSRTV